MDGHVLATCLRGSTLFQEYLKGGALQLSSKAVPVKEADGREAAAQENGTGAERLPYAGTALLGNKEYGYTTRIQKHGRALHAVFWFISTMLLRHTGLVNKVQKYITQT